MNTDRPRSAPTTGNICLFGSYEPPLLGVVVIISLSVFLVLQLHGCYKGRAMYTPEATRRQCIGPWYLGRMHKNVQHVLQEMFVFFPGLCSATRHHFCPMEAKIVTRLTLFKNYCPLAKKLNMKSNCTK